MQRNFKVGDVLRIRQWDDMLREYGADSSSIDCKFSFTEEMRCLCGKKFTVESISPDGHYFSKETEFAEWNMSADMLEYGRERSYDTLDISGIMG